MWCAALQVEVKKMPSCLVNQCANKTGKKGQSEEIILHRFPNDPSKIKVWLEATGQHFQDIDALAENILERRKQNKYALCSIHFKPYCYDITPNKIILRPDAVPSIFPVVAEGENIISEDLKKDRSRTRKRAFEATLSGMGSMGVASLKTQVIDPDYYTKPGYRSIETQTEYTLSNSEMIMKIIHFKNENECEEPITPQTILNGYDTFVKALKPEPILKAESEG
ncbi:uncharacterized protein [Ranitomeya imitator]|uniref:uncharacterized protein isoform X2 n=1 Tax=Ranitomeya imitator TaxID=111125 RepID=UPI0037E91011